MNTGTWKLCLSALAATLIALAPMGCKDNGGQPAPEHPTTGEHPTGEHPTEAPPSGEQPAQEHPTAEHPN